MEKCQLVVLGEPMVGKSCLIIQFVSGCFPTDMDFTIEDYYSKKIDVDGSPILLEIIDIAGQEEFAAMREQYIHIGEAFIIVYSICDARSFKSVRELKKQVDRVKNGISSPILLVGNMSDLQRREITTQEGEHLACEWGCPFFETSARENINVQEAFHEIVREKVKRETSSNSQEPRHNSLEPCYNSLEPRHNSPEPRRRHCPCVCL